jgi:hypothetical protein
VNGSALRLTHSGGFSGRERFMSASVSLLEETSEWPKPSWIQRKLATWRDDTSASREARKLPPKFGKFDGDRVELSVRAVHQVAPAGDAIRAFWQGFRAAQREYIRKAGPAPATISVEGLSGEGNLSDDQAKQAILMLAGEGLIEAEDDGAWAITSVIRHYISTSSLTDYLLRRNRFERRRSLGRKIRKPLGALRHAFRKEGSAVRAIAVGTVAILLAALVLWLGSLLFPHASDQTGPGSKPHTGKASAARHRE